MTTAQLAESVAQRFLSIEDAAKYCTVSRPTMERWLRRRKITAYHPAGSRRVVIDVADLDRLVVGGAA